MNSLPLGVLGLLRPSGIFLPPPAHFFTSTIQLPQRVKNSDYEPCLDPGLEGAAGQTSQSWPHLIADLEPLIDSVRRHYASARNEATTAHVRHALRPNLARYGDFPGKQNCGMNRSDGIYASGSHLVRAQVGNGSRQARSRQDKSPPVHSRSDGAGGMTRHSAL